MRASVGDWESGMTRKSGTVCGKLLESVRWILPGVADVARVGGTDVCGVFAGTAHSANYWRNNPRISAYLAHFLDFKFSSLNHMSARM